MFTSAELSRACVRRAKRRRSMRRRGARRGRASGQAAARCALLALALALRLDTTTAAARGWRPAGWRGWAGRSERRHGHHVERKDASDAASSPSPPRGTSTSSGASSCRDAHATIPAPALPWGRDGEADCDAYYRRYDAVSVDAEGPTTRLLVVRDVHPGIGIGQWSDSRSTMAVLATLADRHVVFESCQRAGVERGRGEGWLVDDQEPVVSCEKDNLPVTFEGRPTGKVPYDWLAYFHQRRPDCHVAYHDPDTRAHPVIPEDALRVVRTEDERKDPDDVNLRANLRRRVIEALMGGAEVVVFEEPFPDLELRAFMQEEWARQSTSGKHGNIGDGEEDVTCCALRALMWKPAPPLNDLVRAFRENGGGSGVGPSPAAFHLRTYDLDDEECRYPYVPPGPDGEHHDSEDRGSHSVDGDVFPDWNALDESMQRCSRSYGRAEGLKGKPPMSTLIGAAASVKPSHPLYIFTDSRAAQGLISTGKGPNGTHVAASNLPFEYPTKSYYYTESDVLDLYMASQAEIIFQTTHSTFTSLAACLARNPKVLNLDDLVALVERKGVGQ